MTETQEGLIPHLLVTHTTEISTKKRHLGHLRLGAESVRMPVMGVKNRWKQPCGKALANYGVK